MKKNEGLHYLIFSLGTEKFAIEVSNVLTLLKSQQLTRPPKMPDHVEGVINFMGKAIPVINTKKRFGMSDLKYSDSQLITVVEINLDGEELVVGMMMDDVHDVINISRDNIIEEHNMNLKVNNDFIDSYVNSKEGIIMLLNIHEVLLSEIVVNEI